MPARKHPIMEFHISREARDYYQFDQALFSLSGNVVLPGFHSARLLAQKMNGRRDLLRFPERAVSAGQINAMGLIDEILHYVVALYRSQMSPQIMGQALDWIVDRVGEEKLDAALLQFARTFPPLAVYRQETDAAQYLEASTGDVPHRQLLLEELLLLWLANANPAFSPFSELFDDAALERTVYRDVIQELGGFFRTQPTYGPLNQHLLEMLRDPAVKVPHSLPGQLEYIRLNWGPLLERYLYRLLGSLDLIREEEAMHFAGPGPIRPYEFGDLESEAERYSEDRDWMPRAVLLAKSTYVWLDQLSRKYRRSITRLDHIPDEELETLARWGFNALWLIGVWQRSQASQRIKQLCGNPEAVASAYSVFDYVIADDLGGPTAFADLQARAWKRGIRMAGDMVPNHVGIDARWVVEHPDWFISLDYPPFPSYTFSGPDLSWDQRVGILLEDHYYDRTDAAVVFQRLDRWTGSARYIYHGNDGTSMPWNDTAQLNYLNPEVREAVIQTILHVARQFPIIRFDAAMTLTKKHCQRLWFPEPGSGGAIPTRAEHGITRAQFDAAMPEEFWREVVDRVAQEAPDTLLLAEAFWLMEGYFVRTLGMHRVYNSAFMNMLKDEENAKYRTTIKNVLEFDPEILKRFVNFMNNPDEDTAVAQFGKDDKYFGVCIMMSTMPGLPMFGHGQVEGYTEKYGMEYRRAYWDEQPDQDLVQRHEREVFPLLQRRRLFADVRDFVLYDFYAPEGHVNEDVFAYSNRSGNQRALVLYHNRFAEARGWIRSSAASLQKAASSEDRVLVQRTLAEALGLQNRDDHFCIFRDHINGLQYIRNCAELHERGLYVELGAYKYHVFLDFKEVQDNIWRHYAQLASYLGGRGVPNIDEALRETFLQPVHSAFRELVNSRLLGELLETRGQSPSSEPELELPAQVESSTAQLLSEVARFSGSESDQGALTAELLLELRCLLSLPSLPERASVRKPERATEALSFVAERLDADPQTWGPLLGWWAIHSLGKVTTTSGTAQLSRSWIDEWLLGKVLVGELRELGLDEAQAARAVALAKVLTSHQSWYEANDNAPALHAYQVVGDLFQDLDVQLYLAVNRYQQTLWFNKESFQDLMWWLTTIAVVQIAAHEPPTRIAARIGAAYGIVKGLTRAATQSEFQVERLLQLARAEAEPSS